MGSEGRCGAGKGAGEIQLGRIDSHKFPKNGESEVKGGVRNVSEERRGDV